MVYKLRIAILRGGPGNEYEVSMKSGSNILNNLSLDKYVIYDIPVSKEGIWYVNGFPTRPEKILGRIDLVFNTLSINGSHNRKIQKTLNDFGVVYVGSDALSSGLSLNKALSKNIYKIAGIKTPYFEVLKKENYDKNSAKNLFKNIPIPCIVKPIDGGSSIGVNLACNLKELARAIEIAMEFSDSVLVEEFIEGREVVCGVLDNFREKEKYSLIPGEITFSDVVKYFNSEMKLAGSFEELSSKRLSQNEKKEIQKIAIDAHNILGLRHYSQSDFIVSSKRGIYLLETNSLPSLDKNSVLLRALEEIGVELPDFLDHLITLAYPHEL